jgi:hypothetical protein
VRQPTRPYLQHASRHRILGSDPTVRPWAYLSGGAPTAIAANGGSGSAITRIVVPSGYAFYTTDDSVFGVDKTTHAGTDYYGIVFKAVGHYDVNSSFLSIDTPTGAVYAFEDDGSGGGDSGWTQGPDVLNFTPIQAPAGVFTVHLNLGEIQSVDGSTFPAPTTPLVFQVRNFTNVSLNGSVWTRVEYIDNDPTIL